MSENRYHPLQEIKGLLDKNDVRQAAVDWLENAKLFQKLGRSEDLKMDADLMIDMMFGKFKYEKDAKGNPVALIFDGKPLVQPSEMRLVGVPVSAEAKDLPEDQQSKTNRQNAIQRHFGAED
jgi:hypothetical protein